MMIKYHDDVRFVNNEARIGNRLVGRIKGSVFVQYGSANQHMLHSPPASCIDSRLIPELQKRGILWVQRTINGESRRIPITRFLTDGFQVNRGHGPQIGVALKYWKPLDEPIAMQTEFLL